MKIVKLRFHLFVSEEDVKENKNNLCHTYFVTCKFVNLLILKTFYLFVLTLLRKIYQIFVRLLLL